MCHIIGVVKEGICVSLFEMCHRAGAAHDLLTYAWKVKDSLSPAADRVKMKWSKLLGAEITNNPDEDATIRLSPSSRNTTQQQFLHPSTFNLHGPSKVTYD